MIRRNIIGKIRRATRRRFSVRKKYRALKRALTEGICGIQNYVRSLSKLVAGGTRGRLYRF